MVDTKATDVASMLNDTNTNIRKYGTQLLAIADYDTAAPEEFWNTDGTPKPVPDGYKIMGYITTDGIRQTRSITTNNTEMVQDIDPVRTDVTARTHTLQVEFGEANAWTKAAAHGVPVSEWPEEKDGDWEYTDSQVSDFPYVRLLILMQDGVGDDAHYAIEFAYRAKITAQGNRQANRTAVDGEDMTFTLFRDPETDKIYYESGHKAKKPGHGPASASTGSTPSTTPAK